MVFSVLAGVALALAVALLIRRITSSSASLPVTAEWIDELSIERYRPMMRLLEGRDLEFLRNQPGFTPKMIAKLRVQRCQIFRGYLRCLSGDFARVCTAIKLVMLHSRCDRPDLAGALMHHQIMFCVGLLSVNFRLLLYRWGLCGVDVSSLVQIFDVTRLELRSLIPVSASFSA